MNPILYFQQINYITGGAGRAAGVNIPTNIQQFRSKLWLSWENTLMSTIYPLCSQVSSLLLASLIVS